MLIKDRILFFTRAYNSTERLVSLVEGLLQAARLEEDRVIFDVKPFNAFKLIDDVLADFQVKAQSKNLNLVCSNFPRHSVYLMGDYDKTKQALSNLIDNAIKYTSRGTIAVTAKRFSGQYGLISVMDTGVGIPKKEQAMIFNKFYRVNNPESVRAGGTGLGLFIVKNLIEKQGGQIWFTSQLDKGTVFYIALPLVKNCS